MIREDRWGPPCMIAQQARHQSDTSHIPSVCLSPREHCSKLLEAYYSRRKSLVLISLGGTNYARPGAGCPRRRQRLDDVLPEASGTTITSCLRCLSASRRRAQPDVGSLFGAHLRRRRCRPSEASDGELHVGAQRLDPICICRSIPWLHEEPGRSRERQE